jgi:two-component system, LytTR family, sensor kinase
MTIGLDTRHWLIRFKLYHLPFWFVYNYLTWVITVGNPVKAAHDLLYIPFTVKYLVYVLVQALAVYFNLYFLIPRYLEQRRYFLYTLFVLLTVGAAAFLIVPVYYFAIFLAHSTGQELFGKNACWFSYYSNALLTTLASTTLAMSIKLTKSWLQSKHRHQLLEKEKLETELNFLRYQFNPHFLFNTINSIFFLIHKNPDMASTSLAKFSELLRYQLYECNDERIALTSEMAYLENFIGLEKLRQDNDLQIALEFDRQDNDQLAIAPFMLMTFVENAFKHVSRHADQPNWIKIRLQSTGHRLDFSIANSVSRFSTGELIRYGGIGLKNVQRRLDLLYPGQYQLDIQHNDENFQVHLQLQLSAIAFPAHMQKTA